MRDWRESLLNDLDTDGLVEGMRRTLGRLAVVGARMDFGRVIASTDFGSQAYCIFQACGDHREPGLLWLS